MMMKDKIFEIVKDFVDDLPDETNFNLMDAEMLDSLALMNVIASLEDEFDIELDGDDITKENFTSIDTITELVRRSLNG